MELTDKVVGDITVLAVKGELDAFNSPNVRARIGEYAKEGRYKIVMNLKEVTFIDSAGMGSVIFSLSHLRRHGGALVLSEITDPIESKLKLVKLYQFFDICDTDKDAVKYIRETKG